MGYERAVPLLAQAARERTRPLAHLSNLDASNHHLVALECAHRDRSGIPMVRTRPAALRGIELLRRIIRSRADPVNRPPDPRCATLVALAVVLIAVPAARA